MIITDIFPKLSATSIDKFWSVVRNMLNKLLRRAEDGYSSSLVVWREFIYPWTKNLRNDKKGLHLYRYFYFIGLSPWGTNIHCGRLVVGNRIVGIILTERETELQNNTANERLSVWVSGWVNRHISVDGHLNQDISQLKHHLLNQVHN
jgi:hypothetical protein